MHKHTMRFLVKVGSNVPFSGATLAARPLQGIVGLSAMVSLRT